MRIEFESGVQPPTETSEPRWLTAVVVALGVAGLVAILTFLPDDGADSGRRLTPLPSTPVPAGPDPEKPDPIGRATSPSGIESEPFDLLIDPTGLRSPFSLVELSPQSSGEQTMQLMELDGTTRSLSEPVYFRATGWPPWPGAAFRPFVMAGSDLVVPSRGQVVVVSTNGGATTQLGEGITVLDGLADDEFWVVGPASRWVTRRAMASIDEEAERIPFVDVGRPLTAAGDGLLVVPRQDRNLGHLALWRPDRPLLPLPVPDGVELLGATEDLVVLGSGNLIVSYDTVDGALRETVLAVPLDMHRVSLSPDGRYVAMSQRHQVTSLGQLVMVDVATGETVSVLDGFVDRDFAWTSPQTIVTVIFDDVYRLIEFDVPTGRSTVVADMRYPWFYVATTG